MTRQEQMIALVDHLFWFKDWIDDEPNIDAIPNRTDFTKSIDELKRLIKETQ